MKPFHFKTKRDLTILPGLTAKSLEELPLFHQEDAVYAE